jgi:hypothetical protein
MERILKASQMVADYIGQIIIDAETAKNETTNP